MKIIEKLIIITLVVSSFLPHLWGIALIKINIDSIIQWLAYRVNALFVGLLLIIAIITVFLLMSKNKKTIVPNFHFNVLDLLVLILFFGIGSFAAIIGLLKGNPIYYVIGDTYIYFTFGILYFLAAYFVRREGIFKIIDFSVYFIFIFVIIETVYRLTGYFLTKSFPVGGIVYYLLPFVFFLSKYQYASYRSKKILLALIISMVAIMLTTYRTLAISMVFIIILLPWLTLHLKRSYLKIAGLFIFFILIAFVLNSTNVLPIFGRYDLSYYYHSLFDPNWEGRRDLRVIETTSAINTMREDTLNYFWGMGQGAIVEMTKGETYKDVYVYGEEGGTFEGTKVHSIHFTPTSVFFRTGILGLTFFFLFLLFTWLFLYKKFSRSAFPQNRLYSEIVLLFFTALIFYSFSRYGIVNDLVLATFLGLIRNPNL